MGTRSTMKFIRKGNNKLTPLVSIYRQYDGYVDGVGHELAKWLLDKNIVNGFGISADITKLANGFGCLIAQYIRDFKTEPGYLYITDMDNKEEYNYEVIFDEDKYFDGEYNVDNLITIKVDSYPNFKGTPSELLSFKESEDDDD